MPYQVLARKYRPLRFRDVVGQDHVTRTLENALEQNRIAHAYIFSGHRGIGKTTIARILASALNCQHTIGSAQRPTPEPCLACDSCREIRQGNAVDVIEIDAATNRGIDEIRELRDAARYRPARDRFKIYILDEAHQITDAAFNALLKTLEEPPDHIVFMMATTEPENIPQTIRSRCQHYSFHAVKLDDILAQLRRIAADEGVVAEPAALDLLAEAGDGSMRDALSIMDQAIASAPTADGKAQLSAAEIRELMGSVPNTVFEEMLEHVGENRAAEVLTVASRLLDAGNSPQQIARQFVRYLRNCVVASLAGLTPESAESDLLQISADERRRVARSAALFTEEELTRFLQVMLRTFDDLGFRQEQRFHLELGLLKLVHLQRLLPMEHFLSQLPAPKQAARRSSADARLHAPATLAKRPGTLTSASELVGSAEASPKIQSGTPVAVSPEVTHDTVPEVKDAPAEAEPGPVESAKVIAAEPAQTSVPSVRMTSVPPTEDESDTAGGSESAAADANALQTAVVEALFAAKSMNSAAEQMEGTTWTLSEGELRIQTSLSRQMITTIFRPESEAIIKGVLRRHGLAGARLMILPGAKRTATEAAPRKPRVGSAQAKALEHPTVQAAQRLFNAEVTNVFDLRRD